MHINIVDVTTGDRQCGVIAQVEATIEVGAIHYLDIFDAVTINVVVKEQRARIALVVDYDLTGLTVSLSTRNQNGK